MTGNSARRGAGALALLACLPLASCGTLRIHRPQDLANAQAAQSGFRAADLSDAVAAERDRLNQVLADELDLVRRHTLARRDARLLYLIGQGDQREAWTFLQQDLAKRLGELGFHDGIALEDRLRREAEAKQQLVELDQTGAFYANERAKDDSLPAATCPPVPNTEPPAAGSSARLFWDDYQRECDQYLGILGARAAGTGTPRPPLDAPLRNGPAIAAMKAAKQAAETATQAASQKLQEAQAAYARSQAAAAGPADGGGVREAFLELDKVRQAIDAFLAGDDDDALEKLGLENVETELTKARTELSRLDLDLSSVVGNLGSVPEVARLEAGRTQVVDALKSTLQGESASRVLDTLKAIGVAAAGPSQAPVTAMVLEEKQLRLDIQAAQNRETFYDQTLALLEQQEAAYRDELAYLGQAELRRRELESKGCLSDLGNDDSQFFGHLFTDGDPAVVECREIVFRLLVQLSAAWTFGRVESEQIDYRLIALHHQTAIDTSDIAFQKWAALLGPPIDQLVAFAETGIRPEDIVTPIVNAFGLGAVAAGVN